MIVELLIVYYGLAGFILLLKEDLEWDIKGDIFCGLMIGFIVF